MPDGPGALPAGVAAIALLLAGCGSPPASPPAPPASAGTATTIAAPSPSIEDTMPDSPVTVVARLTGADATTDTSADWDIGATDLGIMWDDGAGGVLAAFGDTFSTPGEEGAGVGNWRSNVLLRSTDADLSDGMTFDWALTDDTGRAAEIVGSLKVPKYEHTAIPTAGIAVDGRQYLAYMSVREWGAPGQWWTNFSQLAYSDDGGATWSTEGAPRWENTEASDDPFQMVAFERQGEFVYMFGTQNGRFGPASLARVPAKAMLDKTAYRYWDGAGWSVDEAAAVPVVDDAVAELSVRFDERSGLWRMIHLGRNADLVLRVAHSTTGPWGEPQTLATQQDHPGLYGGFMHPWSPAGRIYFAMSIWNPYNVLLVSVDVDSDGNIVPPR